MSYRKSPPPPADPQPTLGEQLKMQAAGEQVAPGVHDGNEAAEEPMVNYVGPYSRYEISQEEWAQAGVEMPTILWEERTGKKVPREVFTEQALQVLRQDPYFRVP